MGIVLAAPTSMRKLVAIFDDIPSAETALEELDDAGLPLGTFRLLLLQASPREASRPRVAMRRAIAGLLVRALAGLLRGPRWTHDRISVVVEVRLDEEALERAARILRASGGRIDERFD